MSRAYLIRADGSVTRNDDVVGHFLACEGRWYRLAGVAKDRNTVFDGQQLEGADGPRNDGCAVYVEIPEPAFAAPRDAFVEVAAQAQGRR